jgi:hypothetical protein
MIKKGGEQRKKKNTNNQEIQPFHAKYAIPSITPSRAQRAHITDL